MPTLEDIISYGHFTKITPEDQGLFLRFFLAELELERYPNSWAYITQACRGLGELGYKFYDGKVLISIGSHKGHYVIVNPLGREAGAAVSNIAQELWHWSGKPVFIKHMKKSDQIYLGNGFVPMAEYPWENDAPYDDATFPEIIVDNFIICAKELDTPKNAKYRLQLHRFERNFPENADPYFISQPYKPEWHETQVRALIQEWAKRDDSRLAPYQNMLRHPPTSGFNLVTVLQKDIVGFHIFDRIGTHTAAAYATMVDYRRFPGASEACFLTTMSALEYFGITRINLGGSETVSLDNFKRKLSPHTVRDTREDHLVYIGDDLPAQSVESPTARSPSPPQ